MNNDEYNGAVLNNRLQCVLTADVIKREMWRQIHYSYSDVTTAGQGKELSPGSKLQGLESAARSLKNLRKINGERLNLNSKKLRTE